MRTVDMIITYCKAHPGEEFTVLDLAWSFGWEMTPQVRTRLSRSVNLLCRYGWIEKRPYTAHDRFHSAYRRYVATP